MPDFKPSLPPKNDYVKHFAKEDKDTKLTALRWVMIRDIAVAGVVAVPGVVYVTWKLLHLH